MGAGSDGRSAALNKAKALVHKQVAFQKRNMKTNCCIIFAPIFFIVILAVLQLLINNLLLGTPESRCGCLCRECPATAVWGEKEDGSMGWVYSAETSADCTYPDDMGANERWNNYCLDVDEDTCGIEYSDPEESAVWCQIPEPSKFPPLMKVPEPDFREGCDWIPSSETLDHCMNANLPVALFYTGENASLAREIGGLIFAGNPGPSTPFEQVMLGTQSETTITEYVDIAFVDTIYVMQDQCAARGTSITLPETNGYSPELQCLAAEMREFANPDAMSNTLYCGFRKGRCNGTDTHPKEYPAAWDFRDTSYSQYHVDVWVNDTNQVGEEADGGPPSKIRGLNAAIARSADAYIRRMLGPEYGVVLRTTQEMPKPGTELRLDFSSLLGPLFYCWVAQFLMPAILVALVYEKHHRLRIMMKMQGLGDFSYWLVTYGWNCLLSCCYFLILVALGSAVGLNFFLLTDYGVQLVFYVLYGNVQIAFCFLLSTFFSSPKTATVVAFLWVFGSGLLSDQLFVSFIQQEKWYVPLFELIPAFGLYRGLYEIGQYAFRAAYQNSQGLTFGKMSDPKNGFDDVLIIFFVEWFVFMILAWYLEQVLDDRTGVRRHPLFFLHRHGNKQKHSHEGGAPPADEPEEVTAERERVNKVMASGQTSDYSIVLQDVVKTYPALDGAPAKHACRSLSLQVPRGECFGLLGPNGAGKSTAISMMTGFLEMDSGSIVIEGADINDDIDTIYSVMGVCPQHDLVWENLTGREHLLFYGRLKNLEGSELTAAVDKALKSVNLFAGGVGNKKSGEYSGGMRRRLSVAISLIGNPMVVYLDEPSTGLDPASRRSLWAAVKEAKRGRALVLTTHSMEEAEVLCDRIGIFVDGAMQCLGHPAALRSVYGGYLVFNITTPPAQEDAVRRKVEALVPGAQLTYALAGTQKFELPAGDTSLAKLFGAVAEWKGQVGVIDWACYHATMEEVFIKIAKSKGAETTGFH